MKDRTAAPLAPGTADGGRRAALALLLALCALLKLVHAPPADYYGPDGSTYFQIARHVAEGDGLRTSVSLYNQGLKTLPGPATVYPLWPLVLGLSGRVLGLERAAHLLPEVLYLVDLLLLYLLTNRLVRAWSGGPTRIAPRWPVDVGHVAVLLLGLNPIFFRYSSLPYTDPLALGLAFAALLALPPAAGARHAALRATLAGVLAGAAYLARTPMIAVPVAVVATLALAVLRDERAARARSAAALAGAVLGCVLVILPWIVFLLSFVRAPHPLMLLDVFTLHSETPELAPVRWIVPPASFGELVAEAWRGLRVAFAVRGPSYVKSFGPVVWAVPLAFVAVVASRRIRAAFARSTDRSIVVASTLAGLGLAVMAQAAHSESDFARLWAFDHRHGLPFMLLVAGALACLLGAPRAPDVVAWRVTSRTSGAGGLRAATLLLVAGSLALAAWRAPSLLAPRGRGPTGTEQQLAQWLDVQPRPPVVIARRASRLAVLSRAGFHWIGCGDDPEQTRILFRHAGAELLVVRRSDRRCRFMAGLEPELELVGTFRGDGPPLELYRFVGAPAPG